MAHGVTRPCGVVNPCKSQLPIKPLGIAIALVDQQAGERNAQRARPVNARAEQCGGHATMSIFGLDGHTVEIKFTRPSLIVHVCEIAVKIALGTIDEGLTQLTQQCSIVTGEAARQRAVDHGDKCVAITVLTVLHFDQMSHHVIEIVQRVPRPTEVATTIIAHGHHDETRNVRCLAPHGRHDVQIVHNSITRRV